MLLIVVRFFRDARGKCDVWQVLLNHCQIICKPRLCGMSHQLFSRKETHVLFPHLNTFHAQYMTIRRCPYSNALLTHIHICAFTRAITHTHTHTHTQTHTHTHTCPSCIVGCPCGKQGLLEPRPAHAQAALRPRAAGAFFWHLQALL